MYTTPALLSGCCNRRNAVLDAPSLIMRATGRQAAPDQTFRELGFDGIDRLCIADEVETALGCELSQREIDAWHSAADVAASIERVTSATPSGRAAA